MLKLSDQEKQEVIRYLEADKPLPEKYRFLLFEDKREVELVWNGKTSEVCNIVLPFQTIEHVDEPRAEKPADTQAQMALFDARGRQLRGWTNKLIWGDNKLILSSLKNGPLREEIEAQGGLKLIYIDPPFDVGADFSMDIEVGSNPPVSPLVRGDSSGSSPDKGRLGGIETFTKKPNILEEIAYRDTWGKGADSFVAMIYERLVLMRDLLAEDGSIYLHMGPNVSHYVRMVMSEVFGNMLNGEITWKRTSSHGDSKWWGVINDAVLFYTKSLRYVWNNPKRAFSDEYIASHYSMVEERTGRRFSASSLTAAGTRQGETGGVWRGFDPNLIKRHWGKLPSELDKLDTEGRIYWPKKEGGWPREKLYLDERDGVAVPNIWDDIPPVNSQAKEDTRYATQKPEALLERSIKASSNEGDLVADFFCGSGTTAAVAEKLGRKWICADLGKFAIHTTRKRMIGVQRQLKANGKDYRAFEILNLGKYERQHFVGVTPQPPLSGGLQNAASDETGGFQGSPPDKGELEGVRQRLARHRQEEKEKAFLDLILHAYRAEKLENFAAFHGKKAGRLVAIGPVNLPVTRLFVEEIILECRKKRITKVDILGFEFEMGLFPNVLDEARAKGIDIAPKYIPAEVFDKRAVERNQVVFHDVAFIEVKPIISYPPDKGGEGGYLPYNTALTEKARENRKNPTPAEQKLWFEVLQNKRLNNLKFSRQKPLDEYIVDFYCSELMLAIEIDGDTHAEQQQYDETRTHRLNTLDVEVIRYTNAEVMNNLEGVYEDLLKRVVERKPPTSSTPLNPPLSGGKSRGLPSVAVELTDFSVFYSQDSIANAEATLSATSKAGSKIVVERGQIVRLSKDKSGVVKREQLTRHWTDWIDYWSVDFDFESKREIISVQNPETGTTEEQWTGDFIFENEWQSFRTKKDRSLDLKSVAHECPPGRHKIAVKVVDIFGNDTMTIVEVTV